MPYDLTAANTTVYGTLGNPGSSEDFFAKSQELRFVFTQWTTKEDGNPRSQVLPAVHCEDLYAEEIAATKNSGGFYSTFNGTSNICPNTTESASLQLLD